MLSSPIPPLTALRPRSIAELSDQIVNLYRLGFLPFVTMSALLGVLPLILNLVTTFLPSLSLYLPVSDDMSDFISIIAIAGSCINRVLQFATLYFFYPLQIAACTTVARAYLLTGEIPTSRALRTALRDYAGPMLGLGVLYFGLSLVCLFLLIIPPIGIAVLTLLSFAFYGAAAAVVAEGLTATEALKRGWTLVCYGRWRVLGLGIIFYLLIGLFSSSAVGLLGVISYLIAEALGSLSSLYLVAGIGVGSVLASLFAMPFFFVAVPLVYYDLRARYEGYDIAVAAARAVGDTRREPTPPRIQMQVLEGESRRAVLQLAGIQVVAFVAFVGLVALLMVLFG